MPEETNGVVVTFKDMYDDLRTAIYEIKNLTNELRESRKTDDDHEKRIRFLERCAWGIPASVIVAVIGLVVK